MRVTTAECSGDDASQVWGNMATLIARHRMKATNGRTYLVNYFEDEAGNARLELPDSSCVEHVSGPLYRIVSSGEIVRLIGSDPVQ